MPSSRSSSVLTEQYHSYSQKWLVVLIAMFANITSGLLWMPYSIVPQQAADYFRISENHIQSLPIIVFAGCVLAGIPAMWVIDRKSLKTGLKVGSLLILNGWLFRLIPIMFDVSSFTTYVLCVIGHILLGLGIPFLSFTPNVIAENWFPETQRLLAVTIVSMGNLFGLMISFVLVEHLLNNNINIGKQTIYLGIPSVLSFMMICCIKHSKPANPPSITAAISTCKPFTLGIKLLFNQNSFWMLFLYIGSAIGSLFSMLIIVRPLVMPNSFYFCGLFGAILIGSGIFGTLISLPLVNRIKELICFHKLIVAGHCISISLLYLAINYSHQPTNSAFKLDMISSSYSHLLILALSALTGFFVHIIIPIGFDFAGDCSFPYNTQAAANGLILISGYIQSVLFSGLMQLLSREVVHCKGYHTVSSNLIPWTHMLNKPKVFHQSLNKLCDTYTDYSVSIMVQTVIMVLFGCFFIIIFETEYRRMNFKRRMQANRLLQPDFKVNQAN